MIFNSQLNLSINSGLHAFLHANFYHQVVHYYENLRKNWIILDFIKRSFLKDFIKTLTLIPPLLIENKFLTGIKTKTSIFNKYFAKQCTLLKKRERAPNKSKVLLIAMKKKFSKQLERQAHAKLMLMMIIL